MIKNLFKSLFLIVSELFNSTIGVVSILFFSSLGVASRFRKYSSKDHSKETCVIMGNGPSLNQFLSIEFDIEKHKQVMALNFFCLSTDFRRVKPKFYIICDPVVFVLEDVGELMKDKLAKMKKAINEELDWSMTLFVPRNFANSAMVNAINNPCLTIVYFNNIPVDGYKNLRHFFYKHNLGLPRPESVIIAAIYLSINMNYKALDLWGVDHSWMKEIEVDENNNVSCIISHFDKVKKEGVSTVRGSLSEFLYSQAILFRSHILLNQYALTKGVKIYNRSKESYIDAYERK